jgi:hypothetical protein
LAWDFKKILQKMKSKLLVFVTHTIIATVCATNPHHHHHEHHKSPSFQQPLIGYSSAPTNKEPHRDVYPFPLYDSSVDDFLNVQSEHSLKRLLANINPPGTVPGVVVASPSHHEPDYWYHWGMLYCCNLCL